MGAQPIYLQEVARVVATVAELEDGVVACRFGSDSQTTWGATADQFLIRPGSILVTYASIGFLTDEFVLKRRARWQSNNGRPCRVVSGRQCNLSVVNRESQRSVIIL